MLVLMEQQTQCNAAQNSGAYACGFLSVKSVNTTGYNVRVPGQTPGLVQNLKSLG